MAGYADKLILFLHLLFLVFNIGCCTHPKNNFAFFVSQRHRPVQMPAVSTIRPSSVPVLYFKYFT